MNTAFGRYRLLERLGQGGMAEVFKAKSYGVEGFEKVLVIKRILPELARSQDFVDMFIHEAKLSVRLSHANIVQVFDLGIAAMPDGKPQEGARAADSYYIAMEFVHGFDLATLFTRCRRQQVSLPIPLCVYIAAEVAKGLDHAHRRRDEQLRPLGIVHRDVSPQNVLLSYEGEVKVTDFGIAKARSTIERSRADDTRQRKLQGKFGYMSPEQSRAENVDARSDLFSLGTILYECLAGVNPFSAPTTFETLRRVQACEFPPVELLRTDVPTDLVGILRTAMAKTPDERFSDAGRMYEAMLSFLYAHGRYSAHDLAEFIAGFREDTPASTQTAIAAPLLDAESPAGTGTERTPVEVPQGRLSSMTRIEAGVRVLAVDRAAEMGERREVTALVLEMPRLSRVSDTSSFSSIAPPSDKAAAILERYGGYIVRNEPEQIYALFGLGVPDGRDTELATQCALVALRALDGPKQPSAGVHIGRIHVSSTGEPTDDERLASLIATARELARVREGACAISAAAMRQVKALYEFESPNDSDAGAPTVAAMIVTDVRSPAETFGRFVGRKDELRRVGEVLATATRRVARVVTLRGDHGTGKTRLLVEVERRLRKGGYNVGFYVATCAPRGIEFPLSGIACMLHVLCGVTDGDPQDRVMAVQPRLRALGLHGDEVFAVLSALGASVPHLITNAKSALRNALTRMFTSLCEDRPHTFAWDAAHGMDADSFAMLEDVYRRLANSRVVFVLSARAGFSHALERSFGHTSLDLTDLPAVDVERLIALRLDVDRVPEALLRFVRERAGGHPLFVEEVLKALVDGGAVTTAEKRIVSMRLVGQELALPKTLRGLVSSRIARLEAEGRTTLQAAAILGDRVDTGVLAQMLGQSVVELERALTPLRDLGFLVRTGPSELRFTSPLVPEIVVDALTPEAAREMHAAAGEALENVLGERASEAAARIATHLYEAGDRKRAAGYFAKSAERRAAARQVEAAARDYTRALALIEIEEHDPQELATWLSGLASAVRYVRSGPEAPEMCDRIVTRLDAVASVAARVRARVDTGRVLGALSRFDAASTRFAEAEAIAAGDAPLVKMSLIAFAELATQQGDFARSYQYLERLRSIVTSGDDQQEKSKILMNLAQAHAAVGERAEALSALERAEAILPDDATATCERHKLRGLIAYFARDFRGAAAAYERAVDSARHVGLTYEVMVNLHNLGDVLIRLGDYARAYGAVQQSLALCDECGYERLGSHNRMFLAYLDGIAGAPEADKLLAQGILYAEANDYKWDLLDGRLMLARLLEHRGHAEDAHHEYERAKTLAVAVGNQLVVQDCTTALASLTP